MRLTLSALLFAGVSIQAAASELDYRYYLTPALGYVKMDRGRLVDDGFQLQVGIGRALSDALNYELFTFYGAADNKTSGETNTYGLGAGLLRFVDRGSSPLYTLGRLQWMSADGHPGIEPDGVSAEGGMGLWFNTGRSGALRLEAGARMLLHGDNDAGAGDVAAGGKTIYLDGIFRIGYAIALGSAPAPMAPERKPVEVVELASADGDGDGVIDDRDLCPGTAPGATVDATGCTVASFMAPETTKAKPRGKPGPADYGLPCRDPVPGEEVDSFGCAIEKAVVLNQVNFEFDSAILTPGSKTVLDDVALALAASPQARIEIAGHTSLEGDEFYNIGLSRRRASAVVDYLASQGVDADRLKVRGYGSLRPLASNESVTGRKENRRVEVKLLQDDE